MNQITLRQITVNDQTEFEKATRNFPKENDFEFIPANLYQPGASFAEFLQRLREQEKGENLPDGYVPGTWLFAFIPSGELVGRVSIRHSLNDYLLQAGGHIGYGVLPAYRKHGYACEILGKTLTYCKEKLSLSKVLLTCDDQNLGSIRTIEKNNGILENKVLLPGAGVAKRRYWISL